ncbi:MAG: DUF1080 domain-containing protein [Verrucomicrobiota bacterium]
MILTWGAVVSIFLLAETVSEEAATGGEAGEWEVLFDGSDLMHWRNYQAEDVDEKWKIIDGALTLTAKGGGDLITREKYGAFELELEFRISPKGNSGLMYHVTEEGKKSWNSGPEIQIIDDVAAKDGQKSGWLYQLYRAETNASKPAGEWNTLRIRISPDGSVHELNGERYFEYVKGSEDWDRRVAASKFSKFPFFGKASEGHICLQDHGNVVSFRNIRVRRLD